MLSFKQYLLERDELVKFWYSSKSRKLVVVTADFHDHEIAFRPKKFGLKPEDVKKFVKRIDRTNIDSIFELSSRMFKAGWVRITIDYNGRRVSWSFEGDKLTSVAAAAKLIAKKHPAPDTIFMDLLNSSEHLQGAEVTTFLKTGKIVVQKTEIGRTMAQFREELTNIPKWWYNTKTRKAVKVVRDFHIQQVFSTPEAFDLTQDDLLRMAPKGFRLRDRIPAIAKPLRKGGWVEVTWLKKPNTALFRAENNAVAQKAFNWFLKKINASPESITVARPDGSDWLKTDAKMTAFAKTGRVIQQTEIGATMARFR